MRAFLLLFVALPVTALAGKPPPVDEVCTHLVDVRASDYGVSVEDSDRATFETACSQPLSALEKKEAKETLPCILEASSSLSMLDCGDAASVAVNAVQPFQPVMDKACDNITKVAAEYAGLEPGNSALPGIKEGCLRDMKLQDTLLTAPEMARKTRCAMKASSQKAVEACWN